MWVPTNAEEPPFAAARRQAMPHRLIQSKLFLFRREVGLLPARQNLPRLPSTVASNKLVLTRSVSVAET
jgi:hypothetical protein